MKMATERRRKNQRGMAIFFYATMLIFVIGCVGLGRGRRNHLYDSGPGWSRPWTLRRWRRDAP